MKPPINKNQKKHGFEPVLEFFLKHKWTVTIAAGAVLVLVLVVIGIQSVSQSNQDKAGRMYDIAQSYINSLRYETNTSKRQQIYQDQLNNLNGLIQTYPNTVAAARARLYLGRAYYEEAYTTGKEESINAALTYYRSVLDSGASDFHKALALIGSAQCSEQKNDYTSAYENYSQVVSRYRKQGFTPLAMIGMARSKEIAGDVQNALIYYRQLVQEFPDSLWNRYALGKIYFYSEPSQKAAATPAPTGSPANILPFNP